MDLMVSKNKVDDYYASISADETANKGGATVKKVKIKAKKKVVVKPKKQDKPQEVPVSKDDVVQSDAGKKKSLVQTLKVVSTHEEKAIKERSSEKAVKKSFDKGQENKTVASSFHQGESGVHGGHVKSKAKSHYGKDAERGDGEKRRKDKMGALGGKTRGKVRYIEEKDVEFVRSNKVSKGKKEEKKIEDIKQNLVSRRGEIVIIPETLTLKELSEKIGEPLPVLIAEFMKNGMMVNINSKIDFDTASIVSESLEIKLEKESASHSNIEDVFAGDLESMLALEDAEKLEERCPVVSIMGHVDHGKTSLLDFIRKSSHAEGEAGGITQSIGAYQVELNDKDHGKAGIITFLDTPGHEAFSVMRARGAKCTDIAILVVAADEGVKPQTIESISHAKEAGIPVIVAVNKMDKEGANPDHVKGQLAEHGLTPEDWGGDTPMVPVSAKSGFGIQDLLDMILLVAEMQELKANPNRNAISTVIESHLDSKLGPVATLLINTGTINAGDDILCQDSFGKVKILKNYKSESIKRAGPGEPVFLVGLDKVLQGGDILQSVESSDIAKQKAMKYKEILSREVKGGSSNLDILMSKIKAGTLQHLKVIIKADTNGSLEAIKSALLKLSNENTSVSVIHSGVGSITEGDVLMGQGSGAILVGFSVGVLPTAKAILDSSGIKFVSSNIIYQVIEEIEAIVTGMFNKQEEEVVIGEAKVAGIFYNSKAFMVAGLHMGEFFDSDKTNTIKTKAFLRVYRNGEEVGKGRIDSLKSGTLEMKELEGPIECGIKFKGNIELQIGDVLQIYIIQK